jgi:hypothetical protein
LYSRFNLEISDFFYNNEINKHLESGRKIYEHHGALAKKSLKEFLYDNGHIDGSSMKENWFQIEDVDIFISHSHQDITKVKAFAGWLYDEFKLTAFIDSCAWGYCDDLLREIDDRYCKKKDGETYNYNLRNYTTSHVHMMLSIALTEMMDNTECIMFYNTPNSVSLEEDLDIIKTSKKRVTLSPWIYHELAMTSLIRSKIPNRTIQLLEGVFVHKSFSEKNSINIEYDIDKYLENMVIVTASELILWKSKYTIFTHKVDGENCCFVEEYENIHPLDVLYNLPVLQK